MDKKYTDKFISLKDEEVNALSKLTNKSTFDELKKVAEMKKVLDTIKGIYKLKISLKSLRYLKIISTVRKFQLNAFKDLSEIKKLLAKNIKEKLKGRRGGRGGGGKASKDTSTIDKAILDAKKDDPLTKLMKDILKSKSSSDLEKAIKDYANVFCQSGIQNLIKTNALGKVFTDMFTVIKQNVNNSIFEGKIGFDNSGWNASKEFMNILTTGLACLTQLKPVFDFFKNLFRRAFRIVTTPFRRGDRPPNPRGGRGNGPDDDDSQPPQPPSSFDRQQRNVLNQLFRQQQQSIESGIIGASGGGSQQNPPPPAGTGTSGTTSQSGFSFSDYFSNLFSGSSQPPQGGTSGGPPSEDDRAGSATDESGAGAIAIMPQPFQAPNVEVPPLDPLPDLQFGGQSEPTRNQFGAGIPSGKSEDVPWDPFNILATGAFLYEAGRFFTNPTPTGNELPPPPEMPQGEAGGEQPQLPRDDGLGFEDEFQREQFEMEEAEKARQEAEQEDEEADLKAIMPPPSSVEVAGSLFSGSKVIPASSYDAVKAAQLASKIFNQMAGAVNEVETIDESLQLKDALTNQQVIEGDIQNQLIRQMVTPADESIIQEEMVVVEGLVQDSFEIIQSMENGSLEVNRGLEILQSTVDYITNVLGQIPKGEDEDEVSRLRILRSNILQSINDFRPPPPPALPQPPRTQPPGERIQTSLNQIESFRQYIQDEVQSGRITPEQGSEALQNLLLQKETDLALQSSLGFIRLNKNMLDDIDKLNEMKRDAERKETVQDTRSQILRNIGQRARRPRSRKGEPSGDIVVSPTLKGLPFPLRPQEQGGTLMPVRQPSLLEQISDAEREQAREQARQIARNVAIGTGRPRDILTRITGVPSNRETLNMVRLRVNRLGSDFGFDAPALFREFIETPNVLNRAGTKLNADGRRMLGELLLIVANDLGIPIEKFFSGI